MSADIIPINATSAVRHRYRHPEPWVTKRQVAEHWGVSISTVERRVRDGLPCARDVGVVRFRLSEADEWMEARR